MMKQTSPSNGKTTRSSFVLNRGRKPAVKLERTIWISELRSDFPRQMKNCGFESEDIFSFAMLSGAEQFIMLSPMAMEDGPSQWYKGL